MRIFKKRCEFVFYRLNMIDCLFQDRERNTPPNCLLLRNIAAYITWLLRVFGVIPDSDSIGFPVGDCSSTITNGDASSSNANKETIVMPYLCALADFRERVRLIAKEHKIVAILEVISIICMQIIRLYFILNKLISISRNAIDYVMMCCPI